MIPPPKNMITVCLKNVKMVRQYYLGRAASCQTEYKNSCVVAVFMKTVRVDMAPLTPNIPDIIKPDFIDNSFEGNSVSRWRDLDDELGYYLETVKHIEGTTCYDELLLQNSD